MTFILCLNVNYKIDKVDSAVSLLSVILFTHEKKNPPKQTNLWTFGLLVFGVRGKIVGKNVHFFEDWNRAYIALIFDFYNKNKNGFSNAVLSPLTVFQTKQKHFFEWLVLIRTSWSVLFLLIQINYFYLLFIFIYFYLLKPCTVPLTLPLQVVLNLWAWHRRGGVFIIFLWRILFEHVTKEIQISDFFL